jgi:hypothetical protein
MTEELLIRLLLDDVAAAVRDGGDTWQGCHMALVLTEHGYVILDRLQVSAAQPVGRSGACDCGERQS